MSSRLALMINTYTARCGPCRFGCSRHGDSSKHNASHLERRSDVRARYKSYTDRIVKDDGRSGSCTPQHQDRGRTSPASYIARVLPGILRACRPGDLIWALMYRPPSSSGQPHCQAELVDLPLRAFMIGPQAPSTCCANLENCHK